MTMRNFRFKRPIATLVLTAFGLFLVQDIFLKDPVYAQVTARSMLERGIDQYKNADFHRAARTLEEAIRSGLDNDLDRVQAFQYLAFCYAVLGEQEKAIQEYTKILDINPVFSLPLTESPRLREPFEEAKRVYEALDRQPPEITFMPPKNAEEGSDITLTARVIDDSAILSVTLFYRKASDPEFLEITMNLLAEDRYIAVIPARAVTLDGIELYLEAFDSAGNDPALAGSPANPFRIGVQMVDVNAPVITHRPVTQAPVDEAIEIECTITDRSGVADATLLYRHTGDAEFNRISMRKERGDTYLGVIPAEFAVQPGIEYVIRAGDAAGNPPSYRGTETDPLQINVAVVDDQPPVIVHDAITAAGEDTPISIQAEVTDPSGVARVILAYRMAHESTFRSVEMTLESGYRYIAEIPSENVEPPNIFYYIEAVDAAGNEPAVWKSPEDPQLIRIKRAEDIALREEPEPEKRPVRKKGKKWLLWVGIATAAVGSGVVAMTLASGKKGGTATPDILIDPPGDPSDNR